MGRHALGVRALISVYFLPLNSSFLTEIMFIMEIRKDRSKSFHLLSASHVKELSPKVETLTFFLFRKNRKN